MLQSADKPSEPTTATKSPDVTAIIPTYNGQRFLGIVLRALANQSLSADRYEVVLVDNNSTVDLFATPEAIAARAQLAIRGVALRVIHETVQGLTSARAAGVAAAAAPNFVFLDDDNEISPNYLVSGLEALEDKEVGVLVSRISPVFYEEPSPAVKRREHLLAINYTMGDAVVRWPASELFCPTIGAGLWFRKAVFQTIQADSSQIMSDRVKDRLVSGGDIELGILAGKLGQTRLYVPSLALRHHLPENRVQSDYFCRLIQGIVRSEMTLRQHYGKARFPWWSRIGRLLFSATAGFFVALSRSDSLREFKFIMASASAWARGPFPVRV